MKFLNLLSMSQFNLKTIKNNYVLESYFDFGF